MGKDDKSKINHRARQRERMLSLGSAALSDKELVEMLLYYVLPRIDTKPVASELLERFSTVGNILNATPEQIREVKCLKDSANVFFTLIRELYSRLDEPAEPVSLFDKHIAEEYLLKLFKDAATERVYVLCLNAQGVLIEQRKLLEGSINTVMFTMRMVTEAAINSNAASVILAHNHPNNSPIPSSEDLDTTRNVACILRSNDIELYDHFIVTKDKCVSILAELGESKSIYDDF